jgi:cytochrome subunit of sulfide dehydrogenase
MKRSDIKSWRGLAAASALATASLAAHAQAPAPDLRAAGYLAANCANCHGTRGQSTNLLPRLAGLSKDDFGRAMREFRDGKRSATLMHQIAKGYSDAQIDLMGEYFSRQPAK